MADNASSASSSFERIPTQSALRAPGWMPVRRAMWTLTALCAMLVVAADVLFYREPIGWTLGLFALLLSIAILVYRSHALSHWPGRLIALGIFGLCLALVDH